MERETDLDRYEFISKDNLNINCNNLIFFIILCKYSIKINFILFSYLLNFYLLFIIIIIIIRAYFAVYIVAGR